MLAEEVLKIRSAGWRIGIEEDIFAFLSGRLAADSKVAILTFDDGLAEQMDALGQLEALGASAIFYVPTAPIVERFVLNVHKLQMIRARVEDVVIAAELDKTFSFGTKEFDDDLLAIQYRYDDRLGRRVKYFLNFMLEEDARLSWTTKYFASLFGDEREVAASLYMSSDDLRRLSVKRLLGSHAHSHLPLATLGDDQMLHELAYSRRLIQEMTTSFPAGVSYPFGGKSSVGHEVFERASSSGYIYGFTMERGINDLPVKANPMALRRIDVNDLDRWLVVGAGDNERLGEQ
ncbi:polysaccharide deacetylase family protein [Synechococcus sp. HJ21-Hayes]|uniref:polysaccharide deacetylase family protein n=1 Tax=unclassified Synechococcus TaxID=2626047 RepID=UPI0020CD7ADC|nr:MULTISPECIES: polysaccharide deacetylase family protein [unclassified Synechococcus]MCP9830081.1 polysaccharide deacetylase family protein [Synechococcus sp. JJ3a-Johnson]MCP9852111.1 polysaccharide deacetylase family protein [Synechococcus sp. HJ21-Hayes]